jgi:hypothetical protein
MQILISFLPLSLPCLFSFLLPFLILAPLLFASRCQDRGWGAGENVENKALGLIPRTTKKKKEARKKGRKKGKKEEKEGGQGGQDKQEDVEERKNRHAGLGRSPAARGLSLEGAGAKHSSFMNCYC